MKKKPANEKLDLYRLHKADYVASKKPVLLQLEPACYLAIAGNGEPGGKRFEACIGALYAIAFTVKMTRKFAGKGDYAIGKLEAQWFFNRSPAEIPKALWRWKMLIRTPDFISEKDLAGAAATLLKKGKPREVEEVKLETIAEGQCVQMLHVGPYERECDTIAAMKEFAEEKGFRLAGPHHEIYLSDPRRVTAERLKTILREPLEKA